MRRYVIGMVVGLALVSACKRERPATEEAPPEAAKAGVKIDRALLAVFGEPLPKRIDMGEEPPSQELIDLGRMLYYDARLSKNHDISCNSCHDLQNYGVDNK